MYIICGQDCLTPLFFSIGTGTHLGAEVVPPPAGGVPAGETDTGASAMKIAYASWTKGSSALLINVNAYAPPSPPLPRVQLLLRAALFPNMATCPSPVMLAAWHGMLLF